MRSAEHCADEADDTNPVGPRIWSEYAGDPDFRELLELFAASVSGKCSTLSELQRCADVDRLKDFAHELKGAGGGYGFALVTDRAARLEEACTANDADAISRQVELLIDVLNRIAV